MQSARCGPAAIIRHGPRARGRASQSSTRARARRPANMRTSEGWPWRDQLRHLAGLGGAPGLRFPPASPARARLPDSSAHTREGPATRFRVRARSWGPYEGRLRPAGRLKPPPPRRHVRPGVLRHVSRACAMAEVTAEVRGSDFRKHRARARRPEHQAAARPRRRPERGRPGPAPKRFRPEACEPPSPPAPPRSGPTTCNRLSWRP